MSPSLFMSHGSPELAIIEHPVSDFLKSLPKQFKKPKRIIVVSAHWLTTDLEILSNPKPELIYDFHGFSKALYEKQYPIFNDIPSVNEIYTKIKKSSIAIKKNSERSGYDHGVWTVLSLMYPQADIPVIQISLPISYGIQDLIGLGEALKEFRKDTLVITSGNVTHNLRDVDWHNDGHVKEYAKAFREWLVENLEKGNMEELKKIDSAPYFRENHPTLDHFLPIFISLGSSADHRGESLLENYMYGNLAMDTIIF